MRISIVSRLPLVLLASAWASLSCLTRHPSGRPIVSVPADGPSSAALSTGTPLLQAKAGDWSAVAPPLRGAIRRSGWE
ncbi:MAG: hypothetical protein HYY93_11725 [Planctomycetes bacterium]|nr:hypothetical protein [Planctomycetota bacterium]